MRDRLVSSMKADRGANGWTRIAGSLNVKPKYLQSNGSYPRVRSAGAEFGAEPGRLTNEIQLHRAGLLSGDKEQAASKTSEKKAVQASKPVRRLIPRLSPKGQKRNYFPDYKEISGRADAARTHTDPDRSSQDFVWVFIAADWGHSEEEIIEELIRVSGKAQEQGRKYAELTVHSAFSALRKALENMKN